VSTAVKHAQPPELHTKRICTQKESGNINADAKHVPTASNMQFCVYLSCIKENGDVLCMYWNVHYKK
jgi:hypothetical protein